MLITIDMDSMMSNMFIVDDKYDVCLSMTWYPGGSHLISGHVFEIVDYFLLLTSKHQVCVLFGDTFDNWSQFKHVIESKYNLSKQELELLQTSTYFCKNPRFIKGRNILFVDGGLCRLEKLGTKLIFDNILTFKCAYTETIHNLSYNVTVLQDDRVYEKYNPEDTETSIHYKKKIMFSKLKSVDNCDTHTALIYATKNCRGLTESQLIEITDAYDFDHYIVITDDRPRYGTYHNMSIVEPPVEDLFTKFNTFIYTPLTGRFDGSPRLPAECKYYNKDVIYHQIDSEYLEHDTGLYWRRHDIDNDYSGLFLTEQDDIMRIIGDVV